MCVGLRAVNGGRWTVNYEPVPFAPSLSLARTKAKPVRETSPGPSLMLPVIRRMGGPCPSISSLPAWFVTSSAILGYYT